MKQVAVRGIIGALLLYILVGSPLMAAPLGDAASYRQLDLTLRASADFQVPLPGTANPSIHYDLTFSSPLFASPLVSDLPLAPDSDALIRMYYDKILLKDGSSMNFGGEKIPLTCVYIEGEDNRASGNTSPLIPQLLLKVYLVANDFTCTGPVNPGWPENGGHHDSWDTFIYYEVRDPTLMIPTEAKVRYRWNDFSAVFITPEPKQ